jgi:glucan biosynthesis protein
MFDYDVAPRSTLDMRAVLQRAGAALTETWVYQVVTG